MTEPQTIHIFLNQPQFLKYKKGLSFQLSKSQIEADSGKNKVDIDLSPTAYKALLKSLQKGKGFRFSQKHVVGGSLYGTIKKGLNFIKKNVKADTVKNVLSKAIDYIPVNDQVKKIGKTLLNVGVEHAYDDSNSNKSLKDHIGKLSKNKNLQKVGLDLAKKAVNKIMPSQQLAVIEGEGISKKRKFAKGSQEAKDFMASLRAKRVTKGGSLLTEIAKGAIHKGIPVVGQMLGTTMGAPIIGRTLGNIVGDAVGTVTGLGLHSNVFHTPYSPLVNGVPSPVISDGSREAVRKHGYYKKQRNPNGTHVVGGSFLALH